MMKSFTFALFLSLIHLVGFAQQGAETVLAGVYQGKTLFVQNPYNPQSQQFCIAAISVNDKEIEINKELSAIMIDFNQLELFTPVQIKISHRDTLCKPLIINPESILFHTTFRFNSVVLSDSLLEWKTKGERGVGSFAVQKLQEGIWVDEEIVKATGNYQGVTYQVFPQLKEGPNKRRIKYSFPASSRRKYLYSWGVEFDFYPEPVEFTPKSAKTKLYLSRTTPYEIYNGKQEKVLSGQGKVIDITPLRRGEYLIYFNGKDPGAFDKQ